MTTEVDVMTVAKAIGALESKTYGGKLASKGSKKAKVGYYVRFQSREQLNFVKAAAQALTPARSLNHFILEAAIMRARKIRS